MTTETIGTALVTGGGRRLGAAIAQGLARAGWRVVVHYHRSEAGALAVVDNIRAHGGHADSLCCDLRDARAIAQAADHLARTVSDWTLLVNCAATFVRDDADALDDAVWDEAIAVNCLAPIRLGQAFLKQAAGQGGGVLINILDQKIANPNPDYFSYSIAKIALSGAAQMMAMAHRADAVRIYNIAPGLSLPSGDQTPAEFETASRMNLLERATAVEDIVATVTYLATGGVDSGQTIFVDSGQHLTPQDRDVMFMVRNK